MTALLLFLLGIAGQGAPPAGVVAGQVVDAAGAPVPDAIVTLAGPRVSPTQPSNVRRLLTDRDGRYAFSDLAPGKYFLEAARDGYAGGGYAQRSPRGESLLLEMATGEQRRDVALTLWRYAIIAGTVLDEAGEPAVGIGVRALPRTIVGGQERFGSLDLGSDLVASAVTDDRGMFRLAQLRPGTYVIAVPSVQTTLPLPVLNAAPQDRQLRGDLFFAGITEAGLPGQPGVVGDGDVAMLTLSRVLVPPPAREGRAQVYQTTFFPNATSPESAVRITLESGEERPGITITLTPVPAVRVSGRLVTPDGTAPPLTAICLTAASAASVVDSGLIDGPGAQTAKFDAVTGMSDADGRFTLLDVPAGEYTVRNCNRFLSRAATQGVPAYWISQRVTVGNADLRDLTIALRPALRVEGRIEFRASGTPPPPRPPRAGIAFETASGEPGRFVLEDRDARFATVAAGGRYVFSPYEISDDWVVQSVTWGEKDLTDRPFDLQSDATSLLVTYTDRLLALSGTVRDGRGTPTATATVLAFPTESERWSGYGARPRRLKSTVTRRDGGYRFANLPAGDYFVIAIDGAAPDGWMDPKSLEALAGVATRVTMSGTDTSAKTADLIVKDVR